VHNNYLHLSSLASYPKEGVRKRPCKLPPVYLSRPIPGRMPNTAQPLILMIYRQLSPPRTHTQDRNETQILLCFPRDRGYIFYAR
jgi:hypothetical protein